MYDKKLLEKVKAGLAKQAFVPAPAQGDPAAAGGMPPGGDPAAGGMPPVDPATGMPADPAMMAGGGMPPVDPSMLAGGMPPVDPMAGGGAPGGDVDPNTGEPYIKITFKQLFSLIDQILKLATKLGNGGQQQQQGQQPADSGNQELVNEVRNLVTAITAR